MTLRELIDLADRIIDGNPVEAREFRNLLDLSGDGVFDLMAGASMIRTHYYGREVQLCSICNGKSGRCSENCSFCAQSAFSKTDSPEYPLQTVEELAQAAENVVDTPIHRFSVVTSGRGLSPAEVKTVADGLGLVKGTWLQTCASLGILPRESMEILKEAGVTRYHHNLESAPSYFDQICTTHSYQERIDTILAAKAAGLSVCAGGIFGLGETDDQALELALTLKKLDVDAVPINFLSPIKGTPLEDRHDLTPLRCLKIIALFRYVLPEKEIIICGGREANLQDLHPMIFYAGASGMMTQNYLTTKGRSLKDDLSMIDDIGYRIRPRTVHRS